ncbi:DUF2651 family protein [Solibacillus silvestris]
MEFLLVLFICPIIVFTASIIGYLITKKWFVVPTIIFILFTVLTFTVFNKTFFFWVLVYTILSFIVSLVMKFIKK